MKLFRDQFSEYLDQPPAEPPARILLIASTPRCGSHMLGHAMAGTGKLGVPYEYCNTANLAEWSRRLGTRDTEHTLKEIMRRRTTPNGVFCLKAHFSQTAQFGGPAPFFTLFPEARVVFIRRADILRQAISYAIARQTGVWITGQEAVSDHVQYDAALIADCLDNIALQNARWTSFFMQAGITPLEVFYETVTRDTPGTVADIARFAGVTSADDGPIIAEKETTPQGQDERTNIWIERYLADRRRDRHTGLLRRLRGRLKRLPVWHQPPWQRFETSKSPCPPLNRKH